MPPALSILLPTFNGARYLRDQLNLILGQTRGDFELLAVDDGSSDATLEILREYAGRDPRIQIIASTGNAGHKARLAELLAWAQGKWVAISDQDDVWALDKLERLTARIGDAAMAFGRSDLIDGDGRSFGRDLLQTLRSPRRPDDRLLTIFRPQISGHAMIATPEVIPESVFASNEPFDWLIGLLATFSRGVVYDHGAVVHHRLHDSNSHNVTIRLRMNPFLLRPRHLEMWFERRNRARERLVAAVELLAQSEVIPREDSVIFAELAEACRAVWAERRPILSKSALRKLILNSLRSLAGSRADFRRAARYVNIAVYGHLHPRVTLGLYRLTD